MFIIRIHHHKTYSNPLTAYPSFKPKPPTQTNMRFILFASIFSFAVAAAVGSADNGETDFNIVEDDTTKLIERQDKKVNIYTNNINYRPYKRTLSKDECDDIVNAYISVLTKKKYKGKSPKETSQNYVVKNYVLRSGSINSLISKNNDVNPITPHPAPIPTTSRSKH